MPIRKNVIGDINFSPRLFRCCSMMSWGIVGYTFDIIRCWAGVINLRACRVLPLTFIEPCSFKKLSTISLFGR